LPPGKLMPFCLTIFTDNPSDMNPKYKTAAILSNAVIILWLGPWIGKMLLPSVFGGQRLQVGLAGLVGLLAPVAALLALRLISSPVAKDRWVGLWRFCQGCLPIMVNFVIWGIAIQTLPVGAKKISAELRADLHNSAFTDADPERRRNAAKAISRVTKAPQFFKNEQGLPEQFQPTEGPPTAATDMQLGMIDFIITDLVKSIGIKYIVQLGCVGVSTLACLLLSVILQRKEASS
jgi:hypothetical protein